MCPIWPTGVLMLVVVALGAVVARRTRFGTSVYALGGGAQTARLMRVPQGRSTVLVNAFSGLMAGLSGIVFSVLTGSGYSLATVGQSWRPSPRWSWAARC